jgi:hypothetical protein
MTFRQNACSRSTGRARTSEIGQILEAEGDAGDSLPAHAPIGEAGSRPFRQTDHYIRIRCRPR